MPWPTRWRRRSRCGSWLHPNHAREFTAGAVAAISRLQARAIRCWGSRCAPRRQRQRGGAGGAAPRLVARVKPYYLHQLDPALGTGRFHVPIEEGRRLLAKLRGRVTGLAWPTYVLDIPGGHGRCRLDLTIWRLTTGCATRLACSVRVRRRRTRRRRRSRPEPGRCRSPAFAARQARCAHSPSTLHPGG